MLRWYLRHHKQDLLLQQPTALKALIHTGHLVTHPGQQVWFLHEQVAKPFGHTRYNRLGHFSFMKGGQVRDELKAANGYEGEDGAFKLNIENNLKKKQQMVVME